MRRPLVAGNWKMNMTLAAARDLIGGIAKGLGAGVAADVAVCPPAVYVHAAIEAARGTPITVGAQNLHHARQGAFTGEISAQMLVDIGATSVIIGHSERRHTIGHLEDDRMINLKTKAALGAGLTPIFCLGETLAERESDQTLDVLTYQLRAGLIGVDGPQLERVVVAYEPVWAIGTGHTASPEQAQEAHLHLRNELRRMAGEVADRIRIVYGGSVKADNAAAIMAQFDVDGGLIGGASLKADGFVAIVNATVAAKAAL